MENKLTFNLQKEINKKLFNKLDDDLLKTIKDLRDELSYGPLYKVRPGFDPWGAGGLPEYSDFEEIDLEELLTKIDGVLDDLE